MNYISEFVFGFGVVVFIVACIWAVCACGKYPLCNKDLDETRYIAIKKRNNWIRSSIVCISFYYWLILNSILTTIIVLYISCYQDMDGQGMKARIFVYSAISLFSAICPYVIDLLGIAKAYRKAYNLIDNAIITDGELKKVMDEGEKIITLSFE